MNGTTAIIRRLVLVQHVLFAGLVVVGVVQGLTGGAPAVRLVLSTLALVGWYTAGARSSTARRHAAVWFAGLVLLWVLTVVVSADMVWVAFPLWMLAGHLLSLPAAVAVSAAVLAVVVGRGGHAEDWSTAAVVGPTLGGMFALALSRGLRMVIRDSLEREQLVARLVAAREESEELHAELAQIQREAGVTAERTRLSRDIHDTLAQGFSSILLLARAGRATEDPQTRARLLASIEAGAAENLEEARRVVGALAPAPLTSGLVDALRSLVSRLEEETTVSGEVRSAGDLATLPPTLEVALLRVAQSALANVRRHAGAGRVVVTLATSGDTVRLDVVDDGRGFDVAALDDLGAGVGEHPERGGYGLRASRERLRELGGGLDVESTPGRAPR